MRGRIRSGQLVTISAVELDNIRIGDIVFVRWKGNYLLHLVLDLDDGQVLIGNNVGKVNGWLDGTDVLGKVISVDD